MKDKEFDKLLKNTIQKDKQIPEKINQLFSDFEMEVKMKEKNKEFKLNKIFKLIPIAASLMMVTFFGGCTYAHVNGTETIISPLLRKIGINSKYEENRTSFNDEVKKENISIKLLDGAIDETSLILGYEIQIKDNKPDNWIEIEGTYRINDVSVYPINSSIDKLSDTSYVYYQIFDASEIKIEGVNHLSAGVIDVIPDRIEAGTYIIAGALVGNRLKITGIIEEHVEALLSKLKEMGVKLECTGDSIVISKPKRYKPINIKTLVFPGFVTDLGQPVSVLLTQADAMSIFEETIFENRMGHVKYLQKMGANIRVNDRTAIIIGPAHLKGKEVVATDLRAGAAMVLAGLVAKGTTTINNIEHILRGYENIVEKLQNVGADIKIVEVE